MNNKESYIINIFLNVLIIFFISSIILLSLYLPNKILDKFRANNLNIFAWAGTFDKDFINEFENENNVKVNISYYDSNEELISKLKATDGYGYDIIIPSDYAVNILIKDKLLKKIDKKRLNFFDKLNPSLLGHYFDINNDYSIPFEWSIFGIGIDKNFFTINGKYYKPQDLSILFSNSYKYNKLKKKYKVIMSNDPYVSIPIGLIYLFKNLDNISIDKIYKVKKLLKKQYQFIEAYSEYKADYYIATGNCPIALASSSYIWRSMKKYSNIDFVIPKDGSILTIENCAISKNASNIDLVYKFLNFIFQERSIINNFNKFSFFPPLKGIVDKLNVEGSIKDILLMDRSQIEKFKFLEFDKIKDHIDEYFIQNFWIDIKS